MMPVRRFIVTLSLAALLSVCAQGIRPHDVVGEWEKQDESLPPINLILSRDGTELVARLRLSGVDLTGSAKLDGNEIRLEFPDREPSIGEFTAQDTLRLRLDRVTSEFVLKKKDSEDYA